MKDAGLILAEKYFQRLSGAITSGGSAVKVYDSASIPERANQPYILLGSYYSTEIAEGSKQSYGQECTLTIDVVTKTDGFNDGKLQSDEIANSVIELIRTRSAGYLDLSPDFQVITTLLDSTQTVEELIPDGMIVRRILRFRHKLQEL